MHHASLQRIPTMSQIPKAVTPNHLLNPPMSASGSRKKKIGQVKKGPSQLEAHLQLPCLILARPCALGNGFDGSPDLHLGAFCKLGAEYLGQSKLAELGVLQDGPLEVGKHVGGDHGLFGIPLVGCRLGKNKENNKRYWRWWHGFRTRCVAGCRGRLLLLTDGGLGGLGLFRLPVFGGEWVNLRVVI